MLYVQQPDRGLHENAHQKLGVVQRHDESESVEVCAAHVLHADVVRALLCVQRRDEGHDGNKLHERGQRDDQYGVDVRQVRTRGWHLLDVQREGQ